MRNGDDEWTRGREREREKNKLGGEMLRVAYSWPVAILCVETSVK